MEMENNIVSFRISKLLKELGFDLDCRYAYNHAGYIDSSTEYLGNDFFTEEDISNAGYNDLKSFLAPTLYDAQQWLIDNHKLIVLVTYIYEYDSTPYIYCIYKEGSSTMLNEWVNDYATYPEALEEGIFQALIYLKIQNEGTTSEK